MKNKEKKVKVLFEIDEKLKLEFQKYAKINDISMSKLLVKFARKYVKKNREKDNELFI